MRIWTIVLGQRLEDAENTRSMLLCRHLMDRGHQVTMWTSAWDHVRKTWRPEWLAANGGATPRPDGLSIRYLKGCGYMQNTSPRRLIDHWMAASDLTRKAHEVVREEGKPDIIVASLPDHATAASAVAFARSVDAAVIVDVRDKWPDVLFDMMEGSPIKRAAAKAIMLTESARARRALARADAVVAMMDSMLEWGLAKGGRRKQEDDRVFFLTTAEKNFGIERPSLPSNHAITRALEAIKGRTAFVFAGTFNNAQHPSFLLDAIELLQERGELAKRKAAFLIGGDGLEAAEVARRSAALSDTHYVGWMKPLEMQTLLSGADVGLLLQRRSSEAFNNKTFSYLASGLPMISCATGDLHHLIEDCDLGLNIPGGDPEALCAAILTLLDDPARLARMKKNVCEMFEVTFDQKANYMAYAEHVEAVARKRAQGAGA